MGVGMLMEVTMLNIVFRVCLSKQMTLKQRFEGSKGAWRCLKEECHREENG